MTLYFFILVTSLFITLVIIPSIIHVARDRHLYDDLGHLRKIHNPGIPRLGGVAIFLSFTITLLLWDINTPELPINYLLTACTMLFAIGIKDDLAGVGHHTKFLIEFIAGLILVIPGNIRISNLHNFFGIYELSYFHSVILSVLIIVFIINAFNLIDGIDGLAATTGIIVNSVFTALFIKLHHYELAAVSLALVGAILGFLRFNLTPAKIFMGDTGSLLIGLISAVMALKFISVNDAFEIESASQVSSSLGIVLAILIGPISDTLRVFIIRLAKGKSPFQGDRNHIHHRMLVLGFTHLQTTLILALLNGVIILLAFTYFFVVS
ncbi:MraY family glycosyltransferase [Pedobacter hiemivivus]|uniref:Undecaprenyl/decaprenyl-phosphate alpha-N-acetylglucosaminyl 1-phosphate transferase n=1 Tax=Pedobacter hiemivivus TaxID=2530454 RepID=A0A4R0N9I4_9SPHI|nr:MraY family glycosyltransferase [Pedobacter hiemivivus]TCC96227.1 undecaprenyl/decaprenyl-phosphate alpha-N-acetylglucosaminyl 1-phosphate transferase [Pedobacter hiemivivus]